MKKRLSLTRGCGIFSRMKHLPIDVRMLADSFNNDADHPFDVWLNLETGEVVELIKEDSFDEDDEEFARREEIQTNPDRFAEVPRLETREQFKLMERFAEAHPDRELLFRALDGKGAFRRFKDTAARIGALEAWYEFHQQSVEQVAREWLESKGISAPAVVRPVLPPPPPPPQVPSLTDLLIWGGPPAYVDGKVTRVMEAPKPDQARRYFAAIARSICGHVGEEWRKRLIENTDQFARDRYSLRLEGTRIVLTVGTEPWVPALFR